jgi:hypothetical protein
MERLPFAMTTLLTASPSSEAHREAQPSPAGEANSRLWRWLFPLLGVGSLLASCILWSFRKQLAGDEPFTRVELGDPSLRHLMHAALHIGDASMPPFPFTAWIWAHGFGLSDLSLRLYSCAGVCGAFLVLFLALRRRFPARSAFLGVAFGLFSCLVVVDQNVEARSYGLYLLLASLAVAQALTVGETPRPRPRDLILLALSQAGLVLGHVLALVYAGLILVALLAVDLVQRRFRLRVYLCCVAGWLALVPWIPAIEASAAVGKPHTWIPMPTFADLAIALSGWLFGGIYFPLFRNVPLGLAAGWGCATVCVVVLVAAAVLRLKSSPSAASRAAIFMAFALLLAPFVFFAVSHLASPIYVARYMIPSAIGVAILAVLWMEQRPVSRANSGVVLASVLLLLPLAAAVLARPDFLDVARVDRLAAGRPVVCPWLQDFMIMNRYNADPSPPLYPLDRTAALGGPAGAIGGFNLMQNYGREGYLMPQLRDASAILSQDSFLVLDDTATNWFSLEIAGNPRFASKLVARIDDHRRLMEVDRRP